jgi:hypothetical protein
MHIVDNVIVPMTAIHYPINLGERKSACQVCEGILSGSGSLKKGLRDCGSATLR